MTSVQRAKSVVSGLVTGIGRAGDGWPLAFSLLLAAVIRLVGISGHDFWFDEALEIQRDRLRWPGILTFAGGPDPPLFRVLMSPLARGTSSEVVLRLPSVAFSVATIWLVYRWIDRIADSRLALMTSALLAIAPVQIYYAQEVSQYALSGMIAAAVLLGTQRVLDRGAVSDWLIFSATSALAMLTYYGLVFLLVPVYLLLAGHAWRCRSAAQWRRLVLAGATSLVVGATLTWAMLARQYQQFAGDNLHPLLQTSAGDLARLLGHKMEVDVLGFLWRPWGESAPRWMLVPPAVLALVGGVWVVMKRGRWAELVFVPLVALAAMWVAYLLGSYPFGFRYAFFLSPLLFALVAAGLLVIIDASPLLGATAAAVVIASQIAFLPNLSGLNPYSRPPHENLGQALRWVASVGEPETPVYLYYGSWAAFPLYKSQLHQPVVRGRNLRRLSDEEKVATVRRELAPYRRVFVVGSHLWGNEKEVLLTGVVAPGGDRRVVALHEPPGAFAALLESDR